MENTNEPKVIAFGLTFVELAELWCKAGYNFIKFVEAVETVNNKQK